MEIIEASKPEHFEVAEILFKEYVLSLGYDISHQNYDQEFDELDQIYQPPDGALFLGKSSDQWIGCVGLRPFDSTICEMKRLYVRKEGRGTGLGYSLCKSILSKAIALGYEKMRLDTLPDMHAAQGMYKKVGFYPIPSYNDNPIEGTLFMEVELKNVVLD